MKALASNIIVEYIISENKSSGGIVLTGNAMSNPHQTVEAVVKSVGKDVLGIEVGNTVLIQKHSVTQIEETVLENFDTKYVGVVKFASVLAIVEK